MKLIITFVGLLYAVFVPTIIFAQTNKPQYSINERERNIRVNIKLPHQSELSIHCANLSAWQGDDAIKNVFNLAALHYGQVKDSFQSEVSRKKLSIKTALREDLLSLHIEEHHPVQQEFVYKDHIYYPMKTTLDTMIILQDVELIEDNKSKTIQVEYIFTLPNLSDIGKLTADGQLLNDISSQVDSVLNVYKRKWKNTDDKRLLVHLDQPNDKIKVNNQSAFFKNTTLYVGFGAELLGNRFPVVIDVGVAYLANNYAGESAYIGLCLSGFYLYNLGMDDYGKSSLFSSLGFELGVGNAEGGLLRPKYMSGFAYFFGNGSRPNEEIRLPDMFRLYGGYSLSSHVTVGIDIMGNFKFNNKSMGLFGVFLKYYL